MRLGLNYAPPHRTPEEWGDILAEHGFRSACFPVSYREPDAVIDAYVQAAKDRDILIAEVGVWDSPWQEDKERAAAAREKCFGQLRLAEYVGARCCVNVSGAPHGFWCGCCRENFSEDLYRRNAAFVQELCDTVKPVRTRFTLEPMQWMVPDSPEQYARFLADVDREGFAVHMDYLNWIKDPYTYTHQDELIARAFDTLGPQIRSCHLKDCLLEPGLTVAIHEVPAGQGEADLFTYLSAIDRLDADMPVLLEHLPDLETYLTAAAHVRALWKEKTGESL